MTRNTYGGGANTNVNGLAFEDKTDLKRSLIEFGYKVEENENENFRYALKDKNGKRIKNEKGSYVYGYNEVGDKVYLPNDKNTPIAILLPQNELRKYVLYRGIDYHSILSKEHRPDEALLNLTDKTLYIIEKKYQKAKGSVDEKLAGFPFKKECYSRLMKPLGYNVEFAFLGGTFFIDDKYSDYYDYLDKHNIPQYFNSIPIDYFNLPKIQ